MRVIKPIDIELISSNVPADATPAYDPAITYSAGQKVLVAYEADGTTARAEEVFVSLRATNPGNYPPDNTDAAAAARRLTATDTTSVAGLVVGEVVSSAVASGTVAVVGGDTGGYVIVTNVSGDFAPGDVITGADSAATATLAGATTATLSGSWKSLGATNRWKMFDAYVNSQTENADGIDVTISCDRCDTLALLDLECSSVTIEVTDDGTGALVFSSVYDMRQDASASWSDYFFAEAQYKTTLCVSIPIYASSSAHIVVANDASPTKCGQAVVGRANHLGASQWSPTVGITDYSIKSTDPDNEGVVTLVQGEWAKELSVDMQIESAAVSALQRRMAGYRGLACVWDCNNETTEHDALILYGYFSDFSIVISGPEISACTMTIQGLI